MIHVLEDDAGVRDSFDVLLRNMGHRVAVYPDAQSFLEIAPPGAGDVAFIDLELPGIGGAEVIRRLQALPNAPRIVVISGQSQRDIDAQLDGIEVPVLLRKPLSETDILASLSETVG